MNIDKTKNTVACCVFIDLRKTFDQIETESFTPKWKNAFQFRLYRDWTQPRNHHAVSRIMKDYRVTFKRDNEHSEEKLIMTHFVKARDQ